MALNLSDVNEILKAYYLPWIARRIHDSSVLWHWEMVDDPPPDVWFEFERMLSPEEGLTLAASGVMVSYHDDTASATALIR